MERDQSSPIMIAKLATQINELIGRGSEGKPVKLKHGGKVVAVLVSPEDAEILAREKREMAADVRAAKRALREIERDGSHTIPWEQVKRELAARKRKRAR